MAAQLLLRIPVRKHALPLALVPPAAALLTVSAALTHLAGPDSHSVVARAASYFDADGEANLWSWYSGLVLALIGIAFAALAATTKEVAPRRAYWLLAAVGLYLSADEIASLHELLFQPAKAFGVGRFGWVALGIPLALIAGAALLTVARAIDSTLRRRLIIAGGVFLVGSVGFESLNEFALAPLDLHAWSPLYLLEVTIEEGLEFAGTILALDAVMLALPTTGPLGAGFEQQLVRDTEGAVST